MEDAFVARPSPIRLLMLLLLGAGLVLLGAWVAGAFGAAPRPGTEWVGWVAVLFFGLCGLLAAKSLFDRGASIMIDRDGLRISRWSDATIPWSAVRAVEFRSVHSQPFACIHLSDPSSYPPKGWAGRMSSVNRTMGFGDLAISTVGTDRRFEELREAIERFGAGPVDRSE